MKKGVFGVASRHLRLIVFRSARVFLKMQLTSRWCVEVNASKFAHLRSYACTLSLPQDWPEPYIYGAYMVFLTGK